MANILGKLFDYIGVEQAEEESYYDDNNNYYEDDYVEETYSRQKKGKVVNIHQNANQKMIIYQPCSYDDTQNIIDSLKSRKSVISNLESMETESAQRVIDIMSGAMYALGGNVHKISRGIFLFAPDNMDVSGNAMDSINEQTYFDYFGR